MTEDDRCALQICVFKATFGHGFTVVPTFAVRYVRIVVFSFHHIGFNVIGSCCIIKVFAVPCNYWSSEIRVCLQRRELCCIEDWI